MNRFETWIQEGPPSPIPPLAGPLRRWRSPLLDPSSICVVISGATDTVGTEFANTFGSKGFNLILVDKDQSKVDELRQQLSIRHGQSSI